MAQVDIAGLLTGIPSLQDPITQGRINAANLPANASVIERTLERYRPQKENWLDNDHLMKLICDEP